VTNITQLSSLDLHHIGELCRRVRNALGISIETMAHQCEVKAHGTISTFEKTGRTDDRTFEKYVAVLKSRKSLQSPHEPIVQKHIDILNKLYTRYYRRSIKDAEEALRRYQCNLSLVNFEHIRMDKNLVGFVEKLERENRPAIILDDLWFIHAINGALLHLFGMSHKDDLLNHWYGWHSIGIKCPKNSPVRNGYKYPSEYFPRTNEYFFENDQTYKHLFTYQMRLLVLKLYDLSLKEDFLFHKWWHQVTSFQLPFDDLGLQSRSLMYHGQEIRVNPTITDTKEFHAHGGTVRYSLGVWEPKWHEAEQVFKEIQKLPDSHKLYYAADYERESGENFHVNSWPEVKEEMKKWDCE
jgi:hypothetical protein